MVTDCWRKENGKWVIKSDPFIDDWKKSDYEELIQCLKNTIVTKGLVYGAFINNELKGFVSVEGSLIGSNSQYMDLSCIHVSQDMRGQGIGRELFSAAKRFAREKMQKSCIYLLIQRLKVRLFIARWDAKKQKNIIWNM